MALDCKDFPDVQTLRVLPPAPAFPEGIHVIALLEARNIGADVTHQ